MTVGALNVSIPMLLNTNEGTVLLCLSGFMLFLAVAWLIHHIFFSAAIRQLPILTPKMKAIRSDAYPVVTVIVPARDEERNIGRCLRTLLSQDYPHLEIIVVDDRSVDGTAAIVEELTAKDSRLKLIKNRALPAGWTGKNHAIHLGLEQASGDYLAFVDADTWYHPRAISEIIAYALDEKADMVSLAGGYHVGTFWEKSVQPIIVTFMGFCVRLWKINDPGSKAAFAAGHFILVKRKAYDAFGGHEAVSRCLLEDFAMASLVKQKGMTLKVAYAPWLMRVRMYQGFKEMCRGWMRIFQAAMGQSPWRIWTGTVEIIVFGLVPWAGVAVGLAGMGLDEEVLGYQVLAVSSALAVLCQASLLVRAFPFSATPRTYVVMLLPAISIVLGLWAGAIYKLCTGGKVSWRGSLYQAETGPNRGREKPSTRAA